MRRLSIMLAAACLALPALAQSGMTNVTASHIESDMSGALLTGKLCLTPVLGTNPNPVGFTANGGAQVAAGQVCYPVTAGALNISVPDTSLATPTGIGYKVALQMSSGYPLYNYTQPIYPNGATWSLDSWTPTQGANVTSPTVSYSTMAPSGNCGTAPAIWYTGTPGGGVTAIYTCVGGGWIQLSTGSATFPAAGAANQPLLSTGPGNTYAAGAALGTAAYTTAISVTTTGNSGAATLTGGVLNIPQYQGVLTLTTSGSSGAATLTGNTLNVPQYAGGGSMIYPGGSGIPVVASGTSWGTTVAAPAGTIVGTTDTQTLTNKSIAATQLTGALQAAQEPTHTGDATNTAGSLAMTVKGINGTLLSGLATGILKNTTATGVPSVAAAGTDYQAPITLTTTGSSGAATFSGNTLNIPQYAGGGSMTWPAAAGIAVYAGGSAWGTSLTAPAGTIVGTTDTQTLTNKSIAATQLTGALPAAQEPAHTGDATNTAGSLAMTVKGINGTLLSGLATGILKNTTTTGAPSIAAAGTDYQAPITLTTTGSSGAATFSGNTLNIPNYTGLSNPMTTANDMIYGGTSGAPTRLAGCSASGSVPCNMTQVPGSAPAWALAGVGGRTVTTTTDTIAATDRGASVTYNSSSAVAVTLTAAATLGNNFDFVVGNLGAGTATLTPGSGTINGASTLAVAQNESCAINSQDNTNYVARCGFSTSSGGSGIANTTFTNATTAIAANSCSASAATVTLTGLATTSVIFITPSTDVSGSAGWGSSGGLVIDAWPSATNTMSYKICNQTASSITPAAVTWNAGAR